MNTFNETFGFIAAICAGIAMLAVFFTVLSYFKRIANGHGLLKMRGFIRDGKLVTVHLSGGRNLEYVRFIGFTENNSVKGGGIPYQLSHMVVFEDKKGARLMIRADSIRMIAEVEDVP